MFNFTDLFFWLYFVIFFISIFFAFFIPGDLILWRIPLSLFQRIVLGIIVGMVLWGWQGFIFGYLNFRWLSYFYLAIFFTLWLVIFFKKHSLKFFIKLNLHNFDWKIILLIFAGTIIQVSAVWFNGILKPQGLYFCCGNITDNILHISLTNQLVKNFPPLEPGMSDVIVKNYHYWSNLVIAELIRIFKLPLIATQFQYSTLFISLFLGLSAMAFCQIVNLGRRFVIWLLFFLYFGGDLIFLLVSVMRRELNFNMSSLEDGAKFLVNPPRAFSIIILFAGISLFILWIRKKDLHLGILTAFVLGSLIGFKVYTGIFALFGFSLLGLYFLITKNFRMLITPLIALIFSLIIYLPVNSGAGGLYFTGFALFENFIVQPWMMLDHLELARRIYLEHNNWLRIIQQEIIYIFVFIVTVFGTKLIGILQTKRTLNLLPKELHIFLLSGIGVSIILGFFFQQKTGGANSFNFLVSVFIIGSIYTALASTYWFKKFNIVLKFFIIVFLIFLTIPRVAHETYLNINNLLHNNGFIISNNELSALNYLREKTNKNSLVLVDYRGLKIDAVSPYVSFLADRSMFLSGMEADLNTHGVDFSDRKKEVDIIFTSPKALIVGKILKKNKIDYLYLGYPYSLYADESSYFTKIVYEGGGITILKVSQEAIDLYLKNNL